MLLLMGDAHVPGKAREIPKLLLKKAREQKPELLLWTGDLTSREVLDELSKVAKVKACKGNMDFLDLPYYHRIESGSRRLLLIHGDHVKKGDRSALVRLGKKYGCSVVVFGHTHKPEAFVEDGVLVVNPGSCTGTGRGGVNFAPSFATLDLDRKEIVFYRLKDGKIAKETFSFR